MDAWKRIQEGLCLSLALARHGDMLTGKRERETREKKPGKSVGVNLAGTPINPSKRHRDNCGFP